MTLKEKINTILINEKLNGVQLAAQIGIQKSAVYNIIKGKTKKLNADTAEKISKAYPKYTYKWLMSTVDTDFKKDIISRRFEDLSDNDITHIIELITQHFDAFMTHKTFYTLIDNIQLKAKNETLKDLYLNLKNHKAK
mgnify:CR=1 FL=1